MRCYVGDEYTSAGEVIKGFFDSIPFLHGISINIS